MNSPRCRSTPRPTSLIKPGSANEIVPVESTHKWQREAEDDVLDRLQRAGLLAPEGDVSKVLETVINNLEITNKLNIQPEVRARVLLTTPLESFTIGHTIVVSRGLLDVLPDEASLAMVLAHELGHIALGHRSIPNMPSATAWSSPTSRLSSAFSCRVIRTKKRRPTRRRSSSCKTLPTRTSSRLRDYFCAHSKAIPKNCRR